MEKKRAVFIDKDGTIVDNSMYPQVPRSKILNEQVLDGLKYLQEQGFSLFIISNQSWVGRGIISEKDAEKIFTETIQKLKENGIEILDYRYCPHKREDFCECKKPRPGMIFSLAKKYSLDLENSYILGDLDEDIWTGKNAGVKTILTLTGNQTHFKSTPDFIIKNLNEVKKIL